MSDYNSDYKEKPTTPSISDLPEPASTDDAADKIKGGRMRNDVATESGDVTQDGSRGGDQG